MKLNTQYQLQTVAGEHIILQSAASTGEQLQVIAFNDTAKMLWESLTGLDFQVDDVAALLQQQYDIDADAAKCDAQAWIDTLTTHHLVLTE